MASADKQSKTMDVWGGMYRHFLILVDTKVKVNESVKSLLGFNQLCFSCFLRKVMEQKKEVDT